MKLQTNENEFKIIKSELDSARNMLKNIYPALNDGKILLKCIDALYSILVKLARLNMGKKCHNCSDMPDDKIILDLFSKRGSNPLTAEYGQFMRLCELFNKRKSAVMEFSRVGRAVMYDEELNIEVVFPKEIGEIIASLDKFLEFLRLERYKYY